jgi:hypothetical protein
MPTLFTRQHLPRQQDPDDEEEQHDCQPNAPWAGWFWAAVWAVIAAAAVGIWLAPWLADGVIQ